MNGWVNNREAGDLRRYRVHYDVIVMKHGFVRVKSKSKSKKTLFQFGTETNKNISSYLKISASHRPESWAMYNIYNMVKCKNNIV